MRLLHITVTPIGLTAATTAAAVRAGISRLRSDELYLDDLGQPLSVCTLPNPGALVPINCIRPQRSRVAGCSGNSERVVCEPSERS